MNILTMAFPARIFRKTIREVVKCANFDKERFAEEIQSHIEDRQTVDFTEQKKRMTVCEKRIGELEMLKKELLSILKANLNKREISEKARKTYSKEQMAYSYLEVYQEVMKK